MNQMDLFTAKERALLAETERKQLENLSQDELGDLMVRVRRLRDKYSDLYRRQGHQSVKRTRTRAAASDSNERTLQKAEILEDSLSRVARHLSQSARASANELKAGRLEVARGERDRKGPATKGGSAAGNAPPESARSSKRSKPIVEGARVVAVSATTKKNQAARDNRAKKKTKKRR